MSAALVLVAEDDTQSREALAALLEEEGYRVTCAAEGNEASRLLASTDFDAALLDIRMPSVGGWEVLRRIRACQRTRTIPVIVVSSSNRPDDVRRSYELGANSYVVKRFDRERPGGYLAEAVRYWIHLNETPRTPPSGGSRWA